MIEDLQLFDSCDGIMKRIDRFIKEIEVVKAENINSVMYHKLRTFEDVYNHFENDFGDDEKFEKYKSIGERIGVQRERLRAVLLEPDDLSEINNIESESKRQEEIV